MNSDLNHILGNKELVDELMEHLNSDNGREALDALKVEPGKVRDSVESCQNSRCRGIDEICRRDSGQVSLIDNLKLKYCKVEKDRRSDAEDCKPECLFVKFHDFNAVDFCKSYSLGTPRPPLRGEINRHGIVIHECARAMCSILHGQHDCLPYVTWLQAARWQVSVVAHGDGGHA